MISNTVFFNSSSLDFENYKEGTSSREMKSKVIFKMDNKNVKKPKHLKNLFFLLNAQKNMKICPMQYGREDREVVVSLPEKSKGYFRSKSKTLKIEEIS